MKSKLYSKILAIGIIVLFIGVGIHPAFAVDTKPSISKDESEDDKDIEEVRQKSTSGIYFNCYIGGFGNGITIPPIMYIVRPRVLAVWSASDGYARVTSYDDNKIYHVNGSQFGISLGYIGYVGLTEYIPPKYIILGFSTFIYIRADSIEGEDLDNEIHI